MSDTLVWIIALMFYAPIHFLGPVLVILLTGPGEIAANRQLLGRVLIDCTFSMLLAFSLAVLIFDNSPQYAAVILLLAMLVPYIHIWLFRCR
jgi:hypothetical protein